MKAEQKIKSLLERAERHVTIGLNSLVDLSIPESTQLARAVMYLAVGNSALTIAKATTTITEQTGTIVSLLREIINKK